MDIFIILFYYFKTKVVSKLLSIINIKKWHRKKIKKHIKRVVKKSLFYKKLYEGYDINDFASLPVIDKKIMMDNFDDLNTVSISKQCAMDIAILSEKNRDFKSMVEDVTIGLSSGTSGNRGIFLVSKKERLKWAGTILAKVLPRSIFSKHKIAFFLRANSNLYETIGGKNIEFMFFDMLLDLKTLISRLSEFNPTMLVAPASILRIIAKEQDLGNININPEKIISVAEVLDKVDENYISKVFSKQIYQIYQCTEGFIATKCSYGNFHINEDILHIDKEYVSENRFIPIITDFSRITQPIIRYRLNDILVDNDKETCPCGLPFYSFSKVEGRCDDIFYIKLRNKNVYKKVFPDFISRAVIFASKDISEYRVVQISETEIKVFIKVNNDFNAVAILVKKSLDNLFSKLDIKQPNIVCCDYEPIFGDKKLRRIERKFIISEVEYGQSC